MKMDGKCSTIYGPLKSRRHGLSLGVNLGDPERKCCSWSCVYCQAGYGLKTDGPTRVPAMPEVVQALGAALDRYPDLDSVTIAGNSEPTAYPLFAEFVQAVLELRTKRGGRWVFNCLSNGSELDQERVRDACDRLDEAWMKIDCGLDSLWAKVNRPLPRLGTVNDHAARIALLKEPRIQTLLWRDGDRERGVDNYTKANLDSLLTLYARIRPRMIHLTTIQRDTATEGLLPVTEAELQRFADQVKGVAEVRVFV